MGSAPLPGAGMLLGNGIKCSGVNHRVDGTSGRTNERPPFICPPAGPPPRQLSPDKKVRSRQPNYKKDGRIHFGGPIFLKANRKVDLVRNAIGQGGKEVGGGLAAHHLPLLDDPGDHGEGRDRDEGHREEEGREFGTREWGWQSMCTPSRSHPRTCQPRSEQFPGDQFMSKRLFYQNVSKCKLFAGILCSSFHSLAFPSRECVCKHKKSFLSEA